jgi:WXXGXW repeat (2 copies)
MKLSSAPVHTVAAAMLATAALSACVIAPPQPRPVVYNTYPVYTQPAPAPAPDTVIVDVAPPPMQVEVVPVAPFVGAVWVGGYWGWNAGRHYWTPGHYVRPVPGHRFVPHRWDRAGGRWAFRGGFWVR